MAERQSVLTTRERAVPCIGTRFGTLPDETGRRWLQSLRCTRVSVIKLPACLSTCFGLWLVQSVWDPVGIRKETAYSGGEMKRSVPPLQPLEKPAARKLLSALTARLVHITELFRLWCGLTPCLMPWESHRNAA